MERPDAFECNSEEYMDIIKGYLKCEEHEISTDFDIFKDSLDYDEDEMWEIPREAEQVLSVDNLTCSTFTWGAITFCKYKGKRVVIEQNASPILVYWKM